LIITLPPSSRLFPYTTLFRSWLGGARQNEREEIRTRHRRLEHGADDRLRAPQASPCRSGFRQHSIHPHHHRGKARTRRRGEKGGDRKSTRLNSSHQIISYAVF